MTVAAAPSVEVDAAYRARRQGRYEAQRVVWRVAGKDPKSRRGFRWAFCGRVANGQGYKFWRSGVPGAPGTRGAVSGVQTCGSVWSCPVCSEIVNAVRQAEVQAAVEKWLGTGNSVTFATLTLRHRACTKRCREVNGGDCGHALRNLWKAAQKSYTRLKTGNPWKRLERDFGIRGSIRLVEVKHGENGWHPHFHVLFFHDGTISDAQIEQFRSRLFGRWNDMLGKEGLSSLEFAKALPGQKAETVGADVRRVSDAKAIADYVTKNGYEPKNTSAASAVAYEVTGSHTKKAGKGGRTPFQILADLVVELEGATRLEDGTLVNTSTGELVDQRRNIALWREWEAASKGKRQLVFSPGLRDMLCLGEEKTDEDIADEGVELNAVEVTVEPPISDNEVRLMSRSRETILAWLEDETDEEFRRLVWLLRTEGYQGRTRGDRKRQVHLSEFDPGGAESPTGAPVAGDR